MLRMKMKFKWIKLQYNGKKMPNNYMKITLKGQRMTIRVKK